MKAHQKTKLLVLCGLLLLLGGYVSIASQSPGGMLAPFLFVAIGLWAMVVDVNFGAMALLMAGVALTLFGWKQTGVPGWLSFVAGVILFLLATLMSAGRIY